MKQIGKILPWAVFAIGILYIGDAAIRPGHSRTPFDLQGYASLPVVDGGRVKPMDTVARVNLKIINGGVESYVDEAGVSQPAIQWLLDAMTSVPQSGDDFPPGVFERRIFKVEDERTLAALDLKSRDDSMYTLEELKIAAPKIIAGARRAANSSNPDALDQQLMELERQLRVFIRVSKLQGPTLAHKVFRIENDQVLSFLGLELRPGLRYALSEFKDKIPALFVQAMRAQRTETKDIYDAKLLELAGHVNILFGIAEYESPRVAVPTAPSENWTTLGDYLASDSEPSEGKAKLFQMSQEWLISAVKKSDSEFARDVSQFNKALEANNQDGLLFAAAHFVLLQAYMQNEPDIFNKIVQRFPAMLEVTHQPGLSAVPFEVFFNHFTPFYDSMMLYLVALIFALLSLLFWAYPVDRESPLSSLLSPSTGIRRSSSLTRAGFLLAVLALMVHSWAIFARMYIQGRPPVTNLYSSAVFIGWGCVCVCLFLEWLFQNGLSLLVGSAMAAITLFIAHLLSLSGDTMEMMQAVLDTNFWLATHVTCVTLGYTATFVAGFIGVAFVVLGLTTKILERDIASIVGKMIYGVVCFAMFLSFTGTVLGGIWADQSWGRFWGWDPKENGALLIVIWNALILHARWGGLVKVRGMAVLAVGGNIVTSWSWFGTNLLGVGLHSYGFMKGAKETLIGWVILNLIVMAVGCLPLRLWRSFAPAKPKRVPEPSSPPSPINLGDSMA